LLEPRPVPARPASAAPSRRDARFPRECFFDAAMAQCRGRAQETRPEGCARLGWIRIGDSIQALRGDSSSRTRNLSERKLGGAPRCGLAREGIFAPAGTHFRVDFAPMSRHFSRSGRINVWKGSPMIVIKDQQLRLLVLAHLIRE